MNSGGKLSLEQWDELGRAMVLHTGMNVRIFDRKERFLGCNAWVNSLCPAIKNDPASAGMICGVAQQMISEQARQERRTVVYECDAGMTKVCVPLFAGDTYLGTVGGCGVLVDDNDLEVFLLSKLLHRSERSVLRLGESVARFSVFHLQEVVDEFQAQAGNLLTKWS